MSFAPMGVCGVTVTGHDLITAGTFSGDSPKFTGESGTERLVDGDCMEIDAREKWQ